MNFFEELKWRGMIHDKTPGTEELLKQEMVTAYVGFDPTADSLHIGHLVSIMMLKHFQLAGHKPIALVGGATGMIGDPSGKSEERNLLNEDDLRRNQECVKDQLSKFLDFDEKEKNCALLVNNYDWLKEFSLLDFLRDVGKHLTVNYMIAKDSVKNRMETGISYTEFTYQLAQGYDFFHLFVNYNCKLQMGGSDQWGNITTGSELVRRKLQKEVYAVTCPLITKADGKKFGKTEEGSVWLDTQRTSPYKFYQFWLNCSDEDALKYIKIFTLFSREEIAEMEKEHNLAPHIRVLQKALAKDITIRVHSENDYNAAIEASSILFGKGTTETLRGISEDLFLSVFEGVPQSEVDKQYLKDGIGIIDLLAEKTEIFASKGEARRMLKDNGVSLNKEKIKDAFVVYETELLNKKYLLIQKGKKNYFLVKFV